MGTDRCAYLSKLRKVDPVPKLWFTLATLLLCVLADSVLAGLLTLAVLSALNLALGGQRPRDLARFLKVPLAFLLVGCLTIVLRPVGTAEALWAFRLLGRWRWGITAENLRLGILVFWKAMGAVSAMYFLSLNTPMTDLTLALERLRVPGLFVELMELIYRFIFLLTGEAGRIRTAQESRLGYRGFRRSVSSLGTLLSVVFLTRRAAFLEKCWNTSPSIRCSLVRADRMISSIRLSLRTRPNSSRIRKTKALPTPATR